MWCRDSGGVKERIGQRLFSLLQVTNACFDAILTGQFIDKHGVLLADAVSAVGGLALHRRIPPGVVVDHGVGSGEVETDTTRLQTDEEEWDFSLLKGADRCFAVTGLAGEYDVGYLQL